MLRKPTCLLFLGTLALAVGTCTVMQATSAASSRGGGDRPADSSQRDKDPMIAAVVGANDWSTSIRSGKLVFRNEGVYPGGARDDFVEEVKVWFDGLRSRVEQQIRRPGAFDEDRRVETYLRIFDGQRVVEIRSPEAQAARVTEVRSLWRLPQYVGMGHSGMIFWHLVGPSFARADPLGTEFRLRDARLAGEERVGDTACLRLDAPAEDVPVNATLTRSWWVAPGKGYALVQVEEVASWPAGEKVSGKRRVETVREWMQTDGGTWVPTVVTRRSYMQEVGGQEELLGTTTMGLVRGEFNTEVREDLFQVDLPEGAEIIESP